MLSIELRRQLARPLRRLIMLQTCLRKPSLVRMSLGYETVALSKPRLIASIDLHIKGAGGKVLSPVRLRDTAFASEQVRNSVLPTLNKGTLHQLKDNPQTSRQVAWQAWPRR